MAARAPVSVLRGIDRSATGLNFVTCKSGLLSHPSISVSTFLAHTFWQSRYPLAKHRPSLQTATTRLATMLLCKLQSNHHDTNFTKANRIAPVCPSCSNMLTISTLKHHELAPSDQVHAGKNRFECRTCPYQMILDRRYYERKNMETKAAEDVLGGADSWKNVDKTEGMYIRRSRKKEKHAYMPQPNAHVKAANVAWPTSGRFKFAVPMSRRRVSTSVWSALPSGVRTDEVFGEQSNTQHEGINSSQRPRLRREPSHFRATARRSERKALVSFLRTILKRGPRPPTYAKLGQMPGGTIAYPALELAALSSKRPRRRFLGAQQTAASPSTNHEEKDIPRRSICVDGRPRILHNSILRKMKNQVGQM
jgi:DNA-directed RNA polymerase subunit M/transcription elongation factor TFIIS